MEAMISCFFWCSARIFWEICSLKPQPWQWNGLVIFVESQELESKSSQSHLNFFESSTAKTGLGQVKLELSFKNCQFASSHWSSSSRQCGLKWNLTFSICFFDYKVVSNELQHGFRWAERRCCFSTFSWFRHIIHITVAAKQHKSARVL